MIRSGRMWQNWDRMKKKFYEKGGSKRDECRAREGE